MTIDKSSKIKNLEEDIWSLIESLKKSSYNIGLERYPVLYALFCDILVRASEYLPDNKTFFEVTVKSKHNPTTAQGCLGLILIMLERQKQFELDVQERKLFLGAEEKIKMAEKSFDNKEYPSTLGNLTLH